MDTVRSTGRGLMTNAMSIRTARHGHGHSYGNFIKTSTRDNERLRTRASYMLLCCLETGIRTYFERYFVRNTGLEREKQQE